MTTALDLINSSMRLATILASGETATADEAVDGLKSLNDILENWSLENLSVWQSDNATLALTVGQASYTVGAGGDLNMARPVRVGSASFARVSGADFPIEPWSLAEYNQIAVKDIGGIPQRLVYLNEYPLGQIILYPVPSQAMTLHLMYDRVLAFPLTLATVLAFPPGYEKALRYTLANNLAPEYGVTPPAVVPQIAASSKGDIKRANKVPVKSSYDPALTGDTGFAYWQRGY